MSTPINMNKVRKDRARAAKKARADRNAVSHGRTKAEKDAAKAEATKAAKHLDGHKREP